MIDDLLKNKTPREKANIKAKEIAKVDFNGKKTSQKYGIKIEIQGVKAIEGGIEIFAKAWKGSKQLGFGKDGTVETERFLIYNPPVLMDDPNGEIVREWTDLRSGELVQRKLKYDPEGTIIQDLAHTITLVGKEGTNIVKGKIGNTTSTFRPAAGANSPVDGLLLRTFINETFTTIRAGTGSHAYDSISSGDIGQFEASATTDQYEKWGRTMYLFNTAAIDAGDEISSAILSIHMTASAGQADLGNLTVNITSASPASDNALVLADFELANYGSTKFAASGIAMQTMNDNLNQYHDWTLNASGIANIDKDGLSKFAARIEQDIDNTTVGISWAANQNEFQGIYFADQTGTANDPKLVVEHAAASTSTGFLLMF